MAWTSPMVFTPNSVLTSSQLNTHLRDNLLELEVGKASQAGSMFLGSGYNKIEERIPKGNYVSNTESTTATDYVNLPTTGPKVVSKTGTRALVFIAAAAGAFTEDQGCFMSYDVTGATHIEASDDRALIIEGLHAAKDNRWCHMILEDQLNPGLNTFTAKYKSNTNTDPPTTSTWHARFLCVWPI